MKIECFSSSKDAKQKRAGPSGERNSGVAFRQRRNYALGVRKDQAEHNSHSGGTSGLGPNAVPIALEGGRQVSGLFQTALNARACYVFAHGAGAGMNHPFMAAVADGLAERGISTLRYNFPYMEEGSRRPDVPAVAQATVRSGVVEASRLFPGLPLFAGGKSFGSRMTSQAQAEAPLPRIRGLIFLGFPLHPPERPSFHRAKHLSEIKIPMLFLQGTRDEFANLEMLEPVVEQLGDRAMLKLFSEADHSFHAPKRAGRSDEQIRTDLMDDIAQWKTQD